MSAVGKAEGNRLELTYGICVLNIKGKNTNISPRKTGSVVEISFRGDMSELQTPTGTAQEEPFYLWAGEQTR